MTFRELQNLDYAKFIENNKEEVTEMNESQMKCSICHRPLAPGENYNASPIKEGCCCRTCYREVVAPTIMCGKDLEALKAGGFEKVKQVNENLEAEPQQTTYDSVIGEPAEGPMDLTTQEPVTSAPEISQPEQQLTESDITDTTEFYEELKRLNNGLDVKALVNEFVQTARPDLGNQDPILDQNVWDLFKKWAREIKNINFIDFDEVAPQEEITVDTSGIDNANVDRTQENPNVERLNNSFFTDEGSLNGSLLNL